MKVYMETPRKKPVIITLETEKEIACFGMITAYDPNDDFAEFCHACHMNPEDVIRFWGKLDNLLARMLG